MHPIDTRRRGSVSTRARLARVSAAPARVRRGSVLRSERVVLCGRATSLCVVWAPRRDCREPSRSARAAARQRRATSLVRPTGYFIGAVLAGVVVISFLVGASKPSNWWRLYADAAPFGLVLAAALFSLLLTIVAENKKRES